MGIITYLGDSGTEEGVGGSLDDHRHGGVTEIARAFFATLGVTANNRGAALGGLRRADDGRGLGGDGELLGEHRVR